MSRLSDLAQAISSGDDPETDAETFLNALRDPGGKYIMQKDALFDCKEVFSLCGEYFGAFVRFTPRNALHPAGRRRVEGVRDGRARRMRAHLLAREVCSGVTRLRTPITADNAARRARCNSVPDRMDAELEREPHYGRARQFEGRHATEYMVTVGEFGASEVRDQSVVS